MTRERDHWLGLRHLALSVTDLDAHLRFYTELLGFTVEWRPDPDNVYLTTGQDNLALHRVEHHPGTGALDHFGFVVTRPEDVELWYQRVVQYGAKVTAAPRKHRDGATSFYFEAPERLVLQIIHHPPLEKPPAGPDPKAGG